MLALTSVAKFMAALDVLVVTTALGTIRRDLHASLGGLEWTLTAYNVRLAGFMMIAAAHGDRFGRRRMLIVGILCFTGGSAVSALSTTVGLLTVGRIAQSVGAALMAPLALPSIATAYAPERRGRALGIVVGITGLATFAGPPVSPDHLGAASGANAAIREIGGILGIAAVTLAFTAAGSFLTTDTVIHGFQAAIGLCALVALAGAGLAAPAPAGRPEPNPAMPTTMSDDREATHDPRARACRNATTGPGPRASAPLVCREARPASGRDPRRWSALPDRRRRVLPVPLAR